MARTQIEMDEATGMSEASQTSGRDIAWLQALEEKVHAAALRIRDLREENAALRGRVEDLEAQLAAPVPTSDPAAERWAEEREEIRGRVARLVEHLEGLGEL